MLTRILLATDGSPASARAARKAASLSAKLGAGLHVVYVAPLPATYVPAESEILDYQFWERMRDVATKEASARLEELVRDVQQEGGMVEDSHAAAGRPEAEIVRLAEIVGADLVVVGNRGYGALRRAVMGSVSTGVVRHAHCPVLVVRGREGDETNLPGRILLALDGSKGAEAASGIAAELSAATGSELLLIRVIETSPYPPYPETNYREAWESDLGRAKRHVRTYLDGRAGQMRRDGLKVADAHLSLGEADREIARLAEEAVADLIVVGSRGLGGIRRALMGSVSDSVVRHAPCSVLVVRGNEGSAG